MLSARETSLTWLKAMFKKRNYSFKLFEMNKLHIDLSAFHYWKPEPCLAPCRLYVCVGRCDHQGAPFVSGFFFFLFQRKTDATTCELRFFRLPLQIKNPVDGAPVVAKPQRRWLWSVAITCFLPQSWCCSRKLPLEKQVQQKKRNWNKLDPIPKQPSPLVPSHPPTFARSQRDSFILRAVANNYAQSLSGLWNP